MLEIRPNPCKLLILISEPTNFTKPITQSLFNKMNQDAQQDQDAQPEATTNATTGRKSQRKSSKPTQYLPPPPPQAPAPVPRAFRMSCPVEPPADNLGHYDPVTHMANLNEQALTNPTLSTPTISIMDQLLDDWSAANVNPNPDDAPSSAWIDIFPYIISANQQNKK